MLGEKTKMQRETTKMLGERTKMLNEGAKILGDGKKFAGGNKKMLGRGEHSGFVYHQIFLNLRFFRQGIVLQAIVAPCELNENGRFSAQLELVRLMSRHVNVNVNVYVIGHSPLGLKLMSCFLEKPRF